MATAFAACSNDENVVNDGPVEAQISAGVSGPVSRAIDNSWEADEIGVIVTTSPSSNMKDLYKNVRYTTTATGMGAANFVAADQGIFFQDAWETVDFAAYGPYQDGVANVMPGTDGVITKSTTDQSTREKQKAFDFIFAARTEASRLSPYVRFNDDSYPFVHKMTRLVIIVKTSATDGFTAAQVTEGTYTLTGLKHEGEFKVGIHYTDVRGMGEATAQATGTASTEPWSLSDYSLKTEGESDQCTFTSILYPQTLGSALTFKATINDDRFPQTYSNNTSINPALEAGKSYEYTITVKKTGIEVSGCIITAWDSNDMGVVDATM